MQQLWRFHAKSVGAWEIESNRSPLTFPLEPGADRSGPTREFFHYMYRALDAAGEMFLPRYVENPPGQVILKSYARLLPAEMNKELVRSWDAEAKKTGAWAPFVLFGGLCRVHVKEDDEVHQIYIPDAFRFSIAARTDRYVLTLATNCDIWFERTISGEDNAEAGSLNSSALGHMIERLEEAMDGKVVACGSGMGVAVNEHGFG